MADPTLTDPTTALVGQSPGMVRARASLRALFDEPRPQPVLLIGEPGTGKELAARILHAGARGSFKVVEAARDPALVEAALFGRAHRSACGALREHSGALEGPGTLLVRDAERLPAELQVRLFRTLARRALQRGDEPARAVEVPRVVLACRPGADLAPVVHVLGWKVVPIELPPLRARREDLGPLVEHLLRAERSRDGHPLRLRPAALEALLRHDWPGNVDELARAVRLLVERHRAVRAGPAHPVEVVHRAFSAALERLLDGAGVAASPAPPAPPARAAPEPSLAAAPAPAPAPARGAGDDAGDDEAPTSARDEAAPLGVELPGVAWAEPPVGWGPLPARPAPLRAPRFTHEGLAAALSAAATFSALLLGAAALVGG